MKKGSFCGHGRSSTAASSLQKGGEEIGLTEVGKGTKRMPVGASEEEAEEACGGQGVRP